MKKKILLIAVLALMVAAPAFAAEGDQQGGNWMADMFKYCQQAMQQTGGGMQTQTMPMGQPGSGGMMGGPMMMREYK